MHMIRTFHSIGQGAFYTEEFDDFTIVYDCGSDRNIPLIKKEIRNTFAPNQTINAVFISHLHDDHVNGLEYLLDYCNVERIFLPLISKEVRLNQHVYQAIKRTPPLPIVQSILNLDENDRPYIGETQIIFVPETGDDSQSELAGDAQNFKKVNTKILLQKPKIGLPSTKEWVFIPFNFRYLSRSDLLKKKLITKGLDYNSIEEFESIWKNSAKRKKLKEIYESIPGSLNTNSLTLYSGPEINTKKHYLHRSTFFCHRYGNWHLSGGLYFGDFDAKGKQKWNQFTTNYGRYWDLVGTVQIPHHGSRLNYNREINMNKPKISIISAGYSNRYRHPHASTVRDIIKDGGSPILITEKTGSRLIHEIIDIRKRFNTRPISR